MGVPGLLAAALPRGGLCAALALPLAACAGSPPPRSAATSPTTSPAAGRSAAVPFPADTSADKGGPQGGGGLGVVAVRSARQAGYDRVVVELAGSGEPGWFAQFVAAPVQQGSGEPVTVAGDTVLQVDLRGLGTPADTGIPAYAGPSRTTPDGTQAVREVVVGPGVLEGEQDVFLGLTGGQRPFRVFSQSDPVRVVVDVRDRP